MRVFVAGASGALGVPLVRRLVAGGHKVYGMTRSAAKGDFLRELGAEPVICDVYDATRLQTAMIKAAPQAVFHLLTSLPKNGPQRAADLTETNRLRTQGTAHLLQAAIVAGAAKFIAESIVLVYGYGDLGPTALRESDLPKPVDQLSARLRPTVRAALALEAQVLQASQERRIEGVVLRFGLLYGPDAGSSRYAARMLRKRMLPLLAGGAGVMSWIHTEDAATACVAAMERGAAGEVYNIVDDEPVSWGDYMTRFAATLNAPKPFSVPLWLSKLGAPYAASTLTSVLRVSNEKAKAGLAWSPDYPTYREGLQTLANLSTGAPGTSPGV